MKAVVCGKFGGPETLTVGECPDPAMAADKVRIRVHAAGANFPDTLIIEGKYQLRPEPPFAPGSEVAGVIEAVGAAVTGTAPGDRVMAITGWGGFAELAVADGARVIPVPPTMDFVTAAGFAMTYGTSMHALKQRGRLAAGETLLVLGAGGGVGLAAVEIGRAMGATVIAAAGSAEKLEAARAAGAQHLLNYREGGLRAQLKAIVGERGVDVVYDPVGGELFEEALRSLAWKGRHLVVGFASGTIPKVPANLPLLKGSEISGVFFGAFRRQEPEEDRRNFEQLFAWHAQGLLNPRIGIADGLEAVPGVLTALAERTVTGKMVVRLQP